MLVVDDGGFVVDGFAGGGVFGFGKFHFGDAVTLLGWKGACGGGGLDAQARMAGDGFVVQVPVGEVATRFLKGAEIGVDFDCGDARELFAEVIGITCAVVGGMQQAVDVVEKVFFGDATAFSRSGIGGLKMRQSGIRDRIATGVATFSRAALRKQLPVPCFFGFFVEVEGEVLTRINSVLVS